ncbi:MAG: zinc-binding dehydrogenase [Deltaproteobacteria bacterium]|nr:zinc-binding dehydrogenase [Deltaproteobacteria bacterium]
MKGTIAVFSAPCSELELREYTLPEVGPEDMLVKIHRANICGSDLHMWRGHGPRLASGIPRVLGHEMMGEVYRLGAGVRRDCLGQPLREGDRVVYGYFVPCGACPACLDGTPACPNRYRHWLGQSVEEAPHFRGAYGEYYYLHRGQTVCKVPSELSDAMVSAVNCALCEALYGLDQIGVRLGDTVVIQGAGGLGLYATALAKDMGAGQVIVLGRRRERLALARAFGADLTLSSDETSEDDRRALVFGSTRGQGADVVAEFVGAPHVVEEGLRLLRPGGRYLWVGNVTPGLFANLDPGTAVRSAHVMKGVIAYAPWVLPRALDFLVRRRHVYPFEEIISHTMPFVDINAAFTFANSGQALRVSMTV